MPANPTAAALSPCDQAGRCLEQAPWPMAAVEGPLHLVGFVNPAFCRLFGKTRGELLGKPFREMLTERGECFASLDRVFRTGKSESHTKQEQQAAAHPAFWSYTMWPVRADERTVGVVIQVTETPQLHEETVAINEALVLAAVRQHELAATAESSNVRLQEEIRERQLAEEALQRAKAQLTDRAGQLEGLVAVRTAQLTATNQQLEAFVHSIAHDLRAPLRSMQGFSAMLVEEAGAAMSELGRDQANRINQSAQFMDAMLRDLLAFSRISQQGVELAPVNLGAVVESVVSRLRTDVQEKRADVQGPGPWRRVLAHEATLAQVLFNLASNALKFARPGVPPLVRLWAEERAGLIRVWVEDNGVGIEPDHQGQIFRLFTRLNGERYAGTGVGLAIVQKGIERMGGRVGVESAAGAGSRFWFELKQA